MPLDRPNKTVEIARPTPGAPIADARLVMWNVGEWLREDLHAVRIKTAGADRIENTIQLTSYDGKQLCFRIDDHLGANAGNAYAVFDLKLTTSDGRALTNATRTQERDDTVIVDFVAPNDYGVLRDDWVELKRYVTTACFTADEPIITDATTFVQLEVLNNGVGTVQNGDCCKFTFAFAEAGGPARVVTSWTGTWRGEASLALTADGQTRRDDGPAVLEVAEHGDEVTVAVRDWPGCVIRGRKVDGGRARAHAGQTCTRRDGKLVVTFTVAEGVITLDAKGLGLLVKFGVEATEGRRRRHATAELLATAPPRG